MNLKPLFCVALFLFLAFYFLVSIMPVSADDEDDWDNLTVTLGLENPVVSKDGYTLEVLKFDGYGMAYLQVLKDDVKLGEVVLENHGSGWTYLDDKKMRLKAFNVTDKETLPMFGSLYRPEAEVVFETKKEDSESVNLDLDLEADKDEYLLDEEVSVDMDLRNTGDIKATNLKLYIDSDGLIVKEGVPENLMLDKGSEKSCELRFAFPNTIKDEYNITVTASWKDSSGSHLLSQSEDFEVTEPLEIYKTTTDETFPGEPVAVSVSVKNVQKRQIKVKLCDLLPATFTLINESSSEENSTDENSTSDEDSISSEALKKGDELTWEFVLPAEEQKTLSYYMSSDQLGAYRVPHAHTYADLSGQTFVDDSELDDTDSDNENSIITVYGNLSYKAYKNKHNKDSSDSSSSGASGNKVLLSSGDNLSTYLDSNGVSQQEIQVENETLNVFVSVPKGTTILDSTGSPLTSITIEQVEEPSSFPEGLFSVGNCYELKPAGAQFDSALSLNLSLENYDGIPYIYCYENGKCMNLNSSVSNGRISAGICDFSVYTVLVESPAEVKLYVNLSS